MIRIDVSLVLLTAAIKRAIKRAYRIQSLPYVLMIYQRHLCYLCVKLYEFVREICKRRRNLFQETKLKNFTSILFFTELNDYINCNFILH